MDEVSDFVGAVVAQQVTVGQILNHPAEEGVITGSPDGRVNIVGTRPFRFFGVRIVPGEVMEFPALEVRVLLVDLGEGST
jgi:hypothetical protein